VQWRGYFFGWTFFYSPHTFSRLKNTIKLNSRTIDNSIFQEKIPKRHLRGIWDLLQPSRITFWFKIRNIFPETIYSEWLTMRFIPSKWHFHAFLRDILWLIDFVHWKNDNNKSVSIWIDGIAHKHRNHSWEIHPNQIQAMSMKIQQQHSIALLKLNFVVS